MQIYYNINY